MARQILLVNGHPDSGGAHFCDAIAAAYEAGAGAAGHRVDRLDIAGLDLPYVTSGAVWKQPAPNDGIRDAQRRIASADHLVFVYPLWLGDMPAMLKSFLEQVSCDGFILSVDDRGRWRQGLKGKSARIIVTMGMPALVYRLYFLSHSVRSFARNVLGFAGVRPVRQTIVGSVEKSAEHRTKWLETIHKLGTTAV